MSDLHDLDAHDQARALRTGQTSSVELVRHHLTRAERLGPALGAFVTLTPERALAHAAAADRRLAAGDPTPFLGVPTAFKDLTSTAGVTTTMGSALLRDNVPDVDAHVVTLVERAGFISIGKTNTPEFGLSSYTDNDVVGPARTPWDRSRNAGGSSGGAAAAVAARILPLAPGSDGGGSIRIPSSACGVFGFKPSRGRVSSGPVGSDWSGLAVDGPISRTVRDAAALLDAMAVPMPGDIRPLPVPATPFVEAVERDPGRLRIARWTRTHLPDVTVDDDAVEAWERASRLLESLGHEVVDVDNPFPRELETQFNVVWSSGIASAPIPPEADPLLRPNTRYWRDRGRAATAVELAAAMSYLEATTRQVITLMQPFDAFLTPTLGRVAQPVEWFNESGDPLEDHHRELLFTPYTALYNMSGQPAASLPLHWTEPTADRPALPLGVMLAAHPGRDDLLFALCSQVEAAAPWISRVPS
ncbi:MAG TPA: amidase [Aeromicrobium sp.]|nr:amidase [Aeromicrobium sp.]